MENKLETGASGIFNLCQFLIMTTAKERKADVCVCMVTHCVYTKRNSSIAEFRVASEDFYSERVR